MQQQLPAALQALIDAFGALPGVGPRSAERYAYSMFKSNRRNSEKLSSALSAVHSGVKQCPVTFSLIDASDDISPLYTDNDRDKQLVAVVEDPFDVFALERTKQFKGTYHVLGGVISPIDGIGPEHLNIPTLLKRIESDKVTELILATNASVEGESTALFIQRAIHESYPDISISRLARGLPVGVDLEYADQMTLMHALQGRRSVQS